MAVVGPYAGDYRVFGDQLWRGASKAAAELNAFGGIAGERLVLVRALDACSTDAEAVEVVANQLVEEQEVHAVLGHFCSFSTIAAARVYHEAGLLMVSPASADPGVTKLGFPGVFRVVSRDDQQGTVAADYMAYNLRSQRVALLHDNEAYGLALVTSAQTRLQDLGLEAVLVEGLRRQTSDYNTLVTKLLVLDVDTVYFGGFYRGAALLIRQLRDQGYRGIFVVPDAAATPEFPQAAGGGHYVDGVYMTMSADPRLDPAGARVVASFRANGFEPEGYTLYAYAGIQVIAAALRARGKKNAEVLGQWLRSTPIPTIIGVKEFDAHGDLKVSDYVLYSWNADGSYTRLY